ncbi:MAG: DUF3179 domain-containing protein [Bacteroidota bacterium]
MLSRIFIVMVFSYVLVCISAVATAQNPASRELRGGELFIALISSPSTEEAQRLVKAIDKTWEKSYEIMVIETIYILQNEVISVELIHLLQKKTLKQYGYNFSNWYQWLWNKEEFKDAKYGDFKSALHKKIDPKFENYFKGRNEMTTIRLDEVRWGGVVQDGIPPLRSPNMISASEASYLEDDNVIFGIEVNGDARAYPKRILAWHEMFVDEVGGIPVAGVYCTLCGTVILYKTQYNGIRHELGTSGFLYRSNKLMYDRATQSLWNTLQGEPVIGPLINKGISLEHLSVVTTSWGEWKRRHPNTTVLSVKTGYRRDYGEGVAYREYFATDRLMFNTPYSDQRLKNKDEVLALRFPEYPLEQLAISSKFLNKNPIYHDNIKRKSFVVLTDSSGANRVFETNGVNFVSYDRDSKVKDATGIQWYLEEHQLVAEDGRKAKRLPYHRAFWFGWYAAYPDTRLVK